jgi:hypothetical protein
LGSAATAVEWREYPRIAPGQYRAYSAVAKFHFDKAFRRWVCFVRWDVFADDMMRVIVRVPQWWNLGSGARPRASHRSKYLAEWVRANGGPPLRGDRLSPKVFQHRIARVEVGDTDAEKSPIPYSVVRKIVTWETGRGGVIQSTSHTVKDGNGKLHEKNESREDDGKRSGGNWEPGGPGG